MAGNDLKRHKLLRLQNWRCCWCGDPLSRAGATLEHLLPDAMGGTEAYENTAVAHKACNTARANNIWQDPHPSFLFNFVRERLKVIRAEIQNDSKYSAECGGMRWTLEELPG